MPIATIHDNNGNTAILTRDSWCGLPYVSGTRTKCGYWESRCELFLFACGQAGFDPNTSTWKDGETGELLNLDELNAEEYELLQMGAIS